MGVERHELSEAQWVRIAVAFAPSETDARRAAELIDAEGEALLAQFVEVCWRAQDVEARGMCRVMRPASVAPSRSSLGMGR